MLDSLTELAHQREHLLVIDSCYQAFDGPLDSHTKRAGPRTIVVQTLSKSHGLAGARVSLIFATPDRLGQLEAWPIEQMVAGPSLMAARVAIGHHERFRAIWSEIGDVRVEVAATLRGWGLDPLPSGGIS